MEASAIPAELGAGPDEMAEWKLRSQSLMYNSDVDRVFSLVTDDKVRYGNSAFGNACVTARNPDPRRYGDPLHSDHLRKLGSSRQPLRAVDPDGRPVRYGPGGSVCPICRRMGCSIRP